MKPAVKRETQGIVARELVSADGVDRDSEMVMVVPYEPVQVAQAWEMAVKGLAYQVAFGAILCDLDASLTRETGGRGGGYQGETLKGWLSENCPSVNYKTAMRWKTMAESVLKVIQDGNNRVTAGMIPAMVGVIPEEPEDNYEYDLGKRRLQELLSAGSQEALMRAALRGPGKPKGTPSAGRRALTAEEKTADAEDEIKELMGRIAAFCSGPKLLMLRAETRARTATALKDFSAMFRDGTQA